MDFSLPQLASIVMLQHFIFPGRSILGNDSRGYQYFEKEQAKLEGTNVPVDKRSRSVLRLFPHISPFFFQAVRNDQPGKGPST